jgi:hypothetical protein
MTDEELERRIEAIQVMLAARGAGSHAKMIEAVPVPVALPAPSCKPNVERRRSQRHHPNDSEPVCQQRVVAARANYDLNTTVFTSSKSGPVSKGANIVIAPTTADTVVNERPSSIFAV